MSVEELLAREAIRDTMAKYNTSGDRLKVDDYVACFTEDGIMESEFVPEDKAFRYAGKAEIRAWQMRWLDRSPGAESTAGRGLLQRSNRPDQGARPRGRRRRRLWLAVAI